MNKLPFKSNRASLNTSMAIARNMKAPWSPYLKLYVGSLLFVLFSTSTARSSNFSLNNTSLRTNSILCPCVLTDVPKGVCYDFLNEAERTCKNRTCESTFTCTNRERASHYCIERAQEVMRVMPEEPGRCSTRQETKHFRVPYSPFDGSELGGQSDFGAQLDDDLHKLEPETCYL